MVGILIPAFNVEKYVRQCLDSVLSQTYPDIKVTVVDDGSTDATAAILDEYAAKDGRVKVIHKANVGVASARNDLLKHGLEGCDRFLFVDADDWLEPDAVESLLSVANRENADIAICNFVKNNDEPEKSPEKISSWEQQTLVREFLRHERINGSLWNKLIKTDLLRGIDGKPIEFDPEIWYGEDALFVWQIIQRVEKVALTSKQLYHYRMNPSSLSHAKYSPEKKNDSKVWATICRDTLKNFPQYHGIGMARWKIQIMWHLFFAAMSGYPYDAHIKQDQQDVRKHLGTILRSDLINPKKKIFALVSAFSYSGAQLLTRSYQ